jgi:hypothetical protein
MKKIIFLLVLLCTTAIFSQEVDEEETAICLTPSTSTHLADLDAIRGLDHSNDIFHLKIYVHVLRKQAEPKLGQSTEDVNRQLKYLYDTFDPLDINFVWNGEIDYIENDTYYGDVGGNTFDIFNTNSHTDGIDIYFFDVEQGNASGGFGLTDDIGGSALLVGGAYRGHKDGGERTPLAWRNIISHEMGHVLFLWHTHHGTFDEGGGGCPEYVNGTNATTCGDFIADTPADPGIFFTNFNSCNILEDPNNNIPDTDSNGDTYVPDTSNLMSYTYPTCMVGFTNNQKSRMKNAIWYLPVLHNTILTNWSYIRTNTLDCYICGEIPKSFTFYSSYNANYTSIVLEKSTNIDVTITQIDNISSAVTVTNLNPNDDEGSKGYFIIGHINGIDSVNQPIWVGLPQAVPDENVNGPIEVSSGQFKHYKIDDGSLRLNGIDAYDWDFPQPNEPYTFFGGPPPNNPTIWEYSYFSLYVPKSGNSVGNQTGYVTVRGLNPCGDGGYGEFNDVCVENVDDPEGDTCTPPIPQPIYYYPNPSSSILEIDLSLQDYKVFDVVIYDENQTVKYSDQSTNVVKTVDTFNLTNGTYYLHIYDGSDVILSAILIINH